MATALWFDESKDDGGEFPGVPRRNLTDEEVEALPAWLQASVKASPMYRATNPNPTPRVPRRDEGES